MKKKKNISCKQALKQLGRAVFHKRLFPQIEAKGISGLIPRQKPLDFEVKIMKLKYVLVLLISITTIGVVLGFKPNDKLNGTKTHKNRVVKNRKPNIILILDDDMGRECLGTYGSAVYHTPNIDKLAASGVKFENMFAQPLCTPSRVKLMTGEYNYRNYTAFGYLNPDQITFGNILQDAGYTTLIAGKWQLNGIYGYKKQGWDDKGRPHHFGFDEYCLWQVTVSGFKGGRYADPLIIQNGKQLPRNKNQYGPDIFCNYILNFLDREKDKKKPFFIYYPMVLTHNPFCPTPDSPEWKDPSKRHEDKIRYFKDMVAYADKNVGKIMDKLKQLGLEKNTLVIFTADNGTNVRIVSKMKDGQKIYGKKGYMVDWGTRVPLIAYWKGHSTRGVSNDLIQMSDILPTLEAAAGIHTPANKIVDGQSFLPQILGNPVYPLQYIYMWYKPNWGGKKFTNGVFARNKTYKLYGDGRFYNLKKDVREQHNIPIDSLNGKTLEIREKLQNILDQKPGIKD